MFSQTGLDRALFTKENPLTLSCTSRKSAMLYIISYCLCFFSRILAAVVHIQQ